MTSQVINKDLGRYAFGTVGVITLIVFSELVIEKIYRNGKAHPSINKALWITGGLLVVIGIAGSEYIKKQEIQTEPETAKE